MKKIVKEDYKVVRCAINNKTNKDFDSYVKRVVGLLKVAEADPEHEKEILRSGYHFSGLSNILYCEAKKYVKIRIEGSAYKKALKKGINVSALINLADEMKTTETKEFWSLFHNNSHSSREFAVDHNPSCQFITDKVFKSWLKYHDSSKIAKILSSQTLDIIKQSDDEVLNTTEAPLGGSMQSKGTKQEREQTIKANIFLVLRNKFKRSRIK
jgi:hypothetical protein